MLNNKKKKSHPNCLSRIWIRFLLNLGCRLPRVEHVFGPHISTEGSAHCHKDVPAPLFRAIVPPPIKKETKIPTTIPLRADHHPHHAKYMYAQLSGFISVPFPCIVAHLNMIFVMLQCSRRRRCRSIVPQQEVAQRSLIIIIIIIRR